ncbi:MAG: NAD-dependent epimerase/dehydratase family protein [Bacteroidota bacterium]
MIKIKTILTGATGMVGEGVLLACLQNDSVSEVLIVSRRHYEMNHPKLKELLIADFLKIEDYAEQLRAYDACFFCAGVSAIGMKEDDYYKTTYSITMQFAKVVLQLNPNIIFNFVSGRHTDSSENGNLMWARVKGKIENALMKLPFKGQYNFRPGFMKPYKEQKNVKTIFKIVGLIYPKLFPNSSLTLGEVGRAMIKSVIDGYDKQVLEVKDIKELAK